VALLSEYYHRETSTTRREEIKNLCIGGISGYNWAKRYAGEKFEEKPIIRWLDILLKNHIHSVHQIGCSSGRELAHFARIYPDI